MKKKIRHCKITNRPVLQKHWHSHAGIIEDLINEIIALVDEGWSISLVQQQLGIVTYNSKLQTAVRSNLRYQNFRSAYLNKINLKKHSLSMLSVK